MLRPTHSRDNPPSLFMLMCFPWKYKTLDFLEQAAENYDPSTKAMHVNSEKENPPPKKSTQSKKVHLNIYFSEQFPLGSWLV